MKQEEANTILHKMSKVIDNNQMVKLNTVLEEVLMDAKLDSKLKSSEEILNAFLTSKRLEGRSEKTLSLYRFTIEKMMAKINKNICTITTEDIRNYLAEYRDEHGVSKATIDGIRRNLSSLYHWLEEEDYIFVSPLRKIHKIKITKKVKPAYSDEELVRLRSHIKSTRDTLIAGGAVGRKLDFIAQEMNREANTILSKTNDLEVSDRAIELKTDIEKVREQIQNIE